MEAVEDLMEETEESQATANVRIVNCKYVGLVL